jgi:hypothetical protein
MTPEDAVSIFYFLFLDSINVHLESTELYVARSRLIDLFAFPLACDFSSVKANSPGPKWPVLCSAKR